LKLKGKIHFLKPTPPKLLSFVEGEQFDLETKTGFWILVPRFKLVDLLCYTVYGTAIQSSIDQNHPPNRAKKFSFRLC
jgi:hypothetical protein